jgi:hypothetical protein
MNPPVPHRPGAPDPSYSLLSPRPVEVLTFAQRALTPLTQEEWELVCCDPGPVKPPEGYHQAYWRHRTEPAQITLQWQAADHLALLLRQVQWERPASAVRPAAESLRLWAEQMRALPWELVPAWTVCELDDQRREGFLRSQCLTQGDCRWYYELHYQFDSSARLALRYYRVPADRRRVPDSFTLPRPTLVRLLDMVHSALRRCA